MKAVRVLVIGSAAFVICGACVGRAADRPERLEPSLRRVLESRPDSTVHVLLRMTRPVQAGDEDQLRQLGLTIGSARGRIVTGSLRAADAVRLTTLPTVEWVELAGVVGVTSNE
jgi:hypothetical protein